jgi:type IV pilus assembly protein PilB
LNLTREDVGDREFCYGRGCEHCSETGYHGRKGIYEYMSSTEAIRELINVRSPSLVLREKAVEQGMRTLREDGVRNLFDGYTTVDEVMRYT